MSCRRAAGIESLSLVHGGFSRFVPAALCCFLAHPDSFADAVLLAIALGGDTDTIASMTGALSGALPGENAIPERWIPGVEGRGMRRRLGRHLHGQASVRYK